MRFFFGMYRLDFSVSPLRTRSRKVLRASSESELRTERDRQEVSAVRAARPADSILSLDVWNTCNQTMRGTFNFTLSQQLVYSGVHGETIREIYFYALVYDFTSTVTTEEIKDFILLCLNFKNFLSSHTLLYFIFSLLVNHRSLLLFQAFDFASSHQSLLLYNCYYSKTLNVFEPHLSAQWRPQALQEFCTVLMFILWHRGSLQIRESRLFYISPFTCTLLH